MRNIGDDWYLSSEDQVIFERQSLVPFRPYYYHHREVLAPRILSLYDFSSHTISVERQLSFRLRYCAS